LLASEVPLEVPRQPLTQSAEVAEKSAERGDASPPTVGACLSAPLVLASAGSCKPLPSAFCGFSLMRNPLGVGAAPMTPTLRHCGDRPRHEADATKARRVDFSRFLSPQAESCGGGLPHSARRKVAVCLSGTHNERPAGASRRPCRTLHSRICVREASSVQRRDHRYSGCSHWPRWQEQPQCRPELTGRRELKGWSSWSFSSILRYCNKRQSLVALIWRFLRHRKVGFTHPLRIVNATRAAVILAPYKSQKM